MLEVGFEVYVYKTLSLARSSNHASPESGIKAATAVETAPKTRDAVSQAGGEEESRTLRQHSNPFFVHSLRRSTDQPCHTSDALLPS